MKNSLTFLFSMVAYCLFSQSGTVTYVLQLDVDKSTIPKDKVEFISQIIDKAKSQSYELTFNPTQSSFVLEEGLNSSRKDTDQMTKIARSAFGSSSDIFIDHKTRLIYSVQDDGVILKSDMIDLDWKLTKETKKIDQYICYKAVLSIQFNDRKGKQKTKEIIAWYAPSLPFKYGPKNFYNLPGLILELRENKTTYLASKITLEKNPSVIKFPKGKTTTVDEYSKKLKSNIEGTILK
jgi:GLPGLI family protein